MTEEDKKLNIEVCELLGWKFDGRDNWTDPNGIEHQALYGTTDKYGEDVPPNHIDGPQCLDLLMQAVETLGVYRTSFAFYLVEEVLGINLPHRLLTFTGNWYAISRIANANSRQRARAFIRCKKELGKGTPVF